MKHFAWLVLGLILFGAMAACADTSPEIEPTSTPEVVDLHVTPAVAHWLPAVAACAEGIPGFGVYTQVLPRADLSDEQSDLVLRLGERLEGDPFVSVVGLEDIVLVAGQDVPVNALSLESLQAIYAGEFTTWAEVPEYSGDVDGSVQAITTLSYPVGHEIELLFRRAYLEDEPVGASSQTFSTIPFLTDLMDAHPYALGYLLASQVPEGMRVLPVTSEDEIASEQWVLAVTSSEPEGKLKQLLLCLQDQR